MSDSGIGTPIETTSAETDLPTRRNIECYRGDKTTHVFDYTGTPPTAIRFYVRAKVDGTLLVALTLAANPTQFSVTGDAIVVTLLENDTDGQAAGLWHYDLEVTAGGADATIAHGRLNLIGDVATDAGAVVEVDRYLPVDGTEAGATVQAQAFTNGISLGVDLVGGGSALLPTKVSDCDFAIRQGYSTQSGVHDDYLRIGYNLAADPDHTPSVNPRQNSGYGQFFVGMGSKVTGGAGVYNGNLFTRLVTDTGYTMYTMIHRFENQGVDATDTMSHWTFLVSQYAGYWRVMVNCATGTSHGLLYDPSATGQGNFNIYQPGSSTAFQTLISKVGNDTKVAFNINAGEGTPLFEFTRAVQFSNNYMVITATITPASASAPGVLGQIGWDSNYWYVCVAANTWKRAALSTW